MLNRYDRKYAWYSYWELLWGTIQCPSGRRLSSPCTLAVASLSPKASGLALPKVSAFQLRAN